MGISGDGSGQREDHKAKIVDIFVRQYRANRADTIAAFSTLNYRRQLRSISRFVTSGNIVG
ncbi:MAG: hypothetical protein ABIH23_04015 [bacterium]